MKYNFDEIIDRKNSDAEKYVDLEKRYGRSDLAALWVADMDFKAAQPIIDAIRTRTEHGIYGYTSRPEACYEAVCAFQRRRKNWEIDKSLMSFSLGIVPTICMFIKELTKLEDAVIIMTPVYRPFFNAVTDAGRTLLESPLIEKDGHFSMNYEDLEEKARQGAKYLILCSPHNPVGRVWSRNELERLGEICLRHGITILSDEIHSDLMLWGNKHTPIAAISEELRRITITCISSTKTFNLAGLQSSVAIFPNLESKHNFDSAWARLHIECNNCLSIAGTQAAFEHGDEWLDQLLEYLEGNIQYAVEYFKTSIPKIKPIMPEGTYLIWLDCRELGLKGEALDAFMINEARLALSTGTYFGKNGEGYMRLNAACPRVILAKALVKLREAVENL